MGCGSVIFFYFFNFISISNYSNYFFFLQVFGLIMQMARMVLFLFLFYFFLSISIFNFSNYFFTGLRRIKSNTDCRRFVFIFIFHLFLFSFNKILEIKINL